MTTIGLTILTISPAHHEYYIYLLLACYKAVYYLWEKAAWDNGGKLHANSAIGIARWLA